jgi:site-specific recombinase XerD
MFARETHARGADLKAVQGLLGHATPTMTMHYIPADLQAMRVAVRRKCGSLPSLVHPAASGSGMGS